jgi:hypothetical protein
MSVHLQQSSDEQPRREWKVAFTRLDLRYPDGQVVPNIGCLMPGQTLRFRWLDSDGLSLYTVEEVYAETGVVAFSVKYRCATPSVPTYYRHMGRYCVAINNPQRRRL